MKITKEDLDLLAAANDSEMVDTVLDVETYDRRRDLVRLARLGLWAEEHGVPALKSYAGETSMVEGDEVYIGRTADKALKAMPGDK